MSIGRLLAARHLVKSLGASILQYKIFYKQDFLLEFMTGKELIENNRIHPKPTPILSLSSLSRDLTFLVRMYTLRNVNSLVGCSCFSRIE